MSEAHSEHCYHCGLPIPSDVVLNVTDKKSVVAALKAAGGRMEREPFEFGKTGILIGMAVDPAGNHIELIQGAGQGAPPAH